MGVLLLALFGYFYTVRPIYQKELLDEQIAEKEMELRKLHEQTEPLKAHVDSLEARRKTLEALLAGARSKATLAEVRATRAEKTIAARDYYDTMAVAERLLERDSNGCTPTDAAKLSACIASRRLGDVIPPLRC
jgi:predicted nucleotidyltransferase